MTQPTQKLKLDITKFSTACNDVFTGKVIIPEGTDTITYIARVVSGNFTLELTKEQRQQLKMAMHGFAYNASPMNFMQMLKRNKS